MATKALGRFDDDHADDGYLLTWHPWHDKLMACANLRSRRAAVLKYKPKHQHKKRLAVMKKVIGKVPEEVMLAALVAKRAHDIANGMIVRVSNAKVTNELALASLALVQAGAALDAAIQKHLSELMVLHKRECSPRGCTWNGQELVF